MSGEAKSKRLVDVTAAVEHDGGELPEGWAISSVGDCFLDVRNGTTATQNRNGTGVPVSRIETIQNCRFDMSRVQHLDEANDDFVENFRYRPGDIAFSHINSFEHVGKTALYNGEPELFIHGMNLLRLRLGHEFVEPSFAHLVMQTKFFREEVRQRVGHAVNQVSINQRNLAEVPFVVAPLAEQRRIVAKLEALLSKVSRTQQRLSHLPTLLKRFRQSVLAAACSGKLTADWREENPEVETQFGFMLEAVKLEELPEGWVKCKLGDYVENYDGKRVPISSKERRTRKGFFPYYGASGVIDSIDGFTHEGEFILIGEDGANLLSRSTPIAFIANGRFWVNNHAHVLRCRGGFPNPFLCYYINSIDLAPFVTGTAQPKLNQANMNMIPVPVPPLAEQQEIVRRVEKLFAFADRIEARLKQAQSQVDRLTQSILAKAFRGELVPTEAELARREGRSYESASELLERIQATKTVSAPTISKRKQPRSS